MAAGRQPNHRTPSRGDTRAIRLGDTAPNFNAATTAGPINFYDSLGDGWGVVFSHPRDYTPVCTTELGTVAGLKPEWDARNVKVVGLIVAPIEDHHGWAGDIEDVTGNALNFPLNANPERNVATLYDMIHPNADNTLTVRSVFLVGPDKKVPPPPQVGTSMSYCVSWAT